MELWTGLMTVLESALRSRLPNALIGIETDSREPWCLKEHQNGHFLAKIYSKAHETKKNVHAMYVLYLETILEIMRNPVYFFIKVRNLMFWCIFVSQNVCCHVFTSKN